jgi:tRNA 5-methylaminomethyl-2-thiouridine biosynthesis bifunctional protein
MTLHHARLEWQDNQPYSSEYDDVYFSSDSGLDETHYVFLAHNQLATRWQHLAQDHFTICETGFGTGLNFLCAWQLWLETAPSSARLHFISTEKYPLHIDDLQKALKLWPSLSTLSDALIGQYPLVSKAWHRLIFDSGRVTLTLLIGDVKDTLPKLKSPVDAWFLDGFSPAKNPDMWQASLFEEMAKHSHLDSTFATFTSAGDIRRGLQSAGFQVSKAPGFGKKREMLFGQYQPLDQDQKTAQNQLTVSQQSVSQQSASLLSTSQPKTVIVIGGGLAGAASAEAMARRGYQVTLIERHQALAQEASGNPLGVLYPRLTGGETPLNALALQGFLYTLSLLKQFEIDPENYQPCGVLQLAFNERERKRIASVIIEYPELVQEINKTKASKLSGIFVAYDGLFIPQAGWLNPAAFCEALTQHPNITRLINTEALSIKQISALKISALKTSVLETSSAENTTSAWQVFSQTGQIAEAAYLIIANATDAQQFQQTRHCEMQSVRGQITLLPATASSKALNTVICTDGYLSPARDGLHCLGATFSPNDNNTEIREVDHQTNLSMLKSLAPEWALAWAQELNSASGDQQAFQGRAAIRATTSDYLPLAGAVLDVAQLTENPPRYNAPPNSLPWLDGLYINAGHGTKGLVNAPICAEIIASLICHEPAPVDCTLLSALDPNRFVLRALGLKRLAQRICED